MGKKSIALIVIVVTILTTIVSPITTMQASAAQSEAEKIMRSTGIMKTDQGYLDNKTAIVTRAQFAQLLVNASFYKGKTTNESNVSLYHDVPKKHWAAGYIQTAINMGWMSGYLNGTFKPEQGITLQEAVRGVVSLLGYTSSDFTGNVIGGQMTLYESKELDKNINKLRTQKLNVEDCTNLFYNLLNATTKEGLVYAQTLGYTLDMNGNPDYLAIVSENTQGPIMADAQWKSKIPFSLSTASYYRDGIKCGQYDINDYDVIYYSKDLQTIWAYDDKVTGTVDSIYPDLLSPQSVVIAGKEYYFETSEMAYEFSTLGSVKEGDRVTLLLGKNGKVAFVLDTYEYDVTITGVVIDTGTHVVENDKGKVVSSDYVIFVDAAGNEYLQDYDLGTITFHKGELVRITYENGSVIVSEYEQGSAAFSGYTFSEDGRSLGDQPLASNVKILDLYEDSYVSVYPSRLANVSINSKAIKYYERNDKGAITQLILQNVTGDQFDYGILEEVETPRSSMSNLFTYHYIIDGNKGSVIGDYETPDIADVGPKGFLIKDNELVVIKYLSKFKVTSITGSTVQDMTSKWPMADDCDVYFYVDGEYVATTLEELKDLSRFDVTAYYDRQPNIGGRVRIIIAENK
ncbi:MAG: S-layer homology domain-containing protein [Clostridiales bacterium]|jgi:hypothetical protein|nr:S-layer homology domain-containing protein [Clostridiales bacterium]